jgi:hypothetical protein
MIWQCAHGRYLPRWRDGGGRSTAWRGQRRQIDGLAWAASADRRLGVDGSGTVLTAWRGQCLQIGRRMAATSTAADRRLQLGVCSSVARRWQPAWRQSSSPAATQSGENVIGRLGNGSSATTTRRLLDVGLVRFASVEDGNTVIGRRDWV